MPTDDNAADGNLGKYRVQLIWRRYARYLFENNPSVSALQFEKDCDKMLTDFQGGHKDGE